MYAKGDAIKIRNKVGILTIHIIREMDMRDVARCLGDDRLPDLVKPRLEVHTCGESTLVTLCQRSDEFPQNMYIVVVEPYEKPKVYLGEFSEAEGEEMVFETVGI
jgi:hypothetical protein